MKRFLIVALAGLLLVAVACTSPVVPMAVPTVEPTIPSTLEHLPTATIKPTQRPSPTPPVIPVPYTIITPTRVVTLTVTEITGTISTRGKAAVIWTDGKDETKASLQHFNLGLLDLASKSITVMAYSMSMNSELPIYLLWSPDGTRLILHGRSPLGQYDVLGVQLENKIEWRILHSRVYGGFRCDWPESSDGRYFVCSYASHGEPSVFIVHDPTSWEVICVDDPLLGKICPYLQLTDGRWWQPRLGVREGSQQPPTLSTTQASSTIDDRYVSWNVDDQLRLFDTINHTVTAYILPGAKILNVTWSPVK